MVGFAAAASRWNRSQCLEFELQRSAFTRSVLGLLLQPRSSSARSRFFKAIRLFSFLHPSLPFVGFPSPPSIDRTTRTSNGEAIACGCTDTALTFYTPILPSRSPANYPSELSPSQPLSHYISRSRAAHPLHACLCLTSHIILANP